MNDQLNSILGIEFNWMNLIESFLVSYAPKVKQRGLMDEMVNDVAGDIIIALLSDETNGLKDALTKAEGLEQLKSVIIQAARFRARSLLRTDRKSRYSSKGTQFSQLSSDENVFDVADKYLTVELLEREEQMNQLRNVLQRLSNTDRQAIEAFYFDDMSIHEMVDRFNAPLGTIKRRLHDARVHLRHELKVA